MYSQNNEEKVIRDYFGDFAGSLLDIGANDGVTLSNSRWFLEHGWGGVLVEPSAKCFKRLNELYQQPNIQLLNYAIGNKCGKVEFWEGGDHLGNGDHSLLSTIKETELERWAGSKYANHVKTTAECIDVPTLMELSIYDCFDYISIDAEGVDLDILLQLDLTLTGLVCIEWNGIAEVKQEIEKYCLSFDMRTIHTNGENLILAR